MTTEFNAPVVSWRVRGTSLTVGGWGKGRILGWLESEALGVSSLLGVEYSD